MRAFGALWLESVPLCQLALIRRFHGVQHLNVCAVQHSPQEVHQLLSGVWGRCLLLGTCHVLRHACCAAWRAGGRVPLPRRQGVLLSLLLLLPLLSGLLVQPGADRERA